MKCPTARGSRDPVFLVPVVLALALAAGCGATPQRRYYTLSYPLESDRVTESRPALHPVRLRIRPFHVALPYDRPQMVYRQSPYEFQYDPYRLWASKPQQMLREMIEQHVRATRLVLETTREFGDQPPAYELAADVRAIEEFDAGDAWYAHLSMRFDLIRFSDQSVIWHHEFDRKRRVHARNTVYVVRAMSEILREEMQRLAAELDRALSQDRGVPATLPMPPPPPDDSTGTAGAPLPSPEPAADPTHPRPDADGTAKPPAAPAPRDDLIVPDEGAGR
jgi:uncharacterized lipoprotein YmbA